MLDQVRQMIFTFQYFVSGSARLTENIHQQIIQKHLNLEIVRESAWWSHHQHKTSRHLICTSYGKKCILIIFHFLNKAHSLEMKNTGSWNHRHVDTDIQMLIIIVLILHKSGFIHRHYNAINHWIILILNSFLALSRFDTGN